MTGAATTISAPPPNPAANRQAKNQANDNGYAEAGNDAAVSSMAPRSKVAGAMRDASGRASRAPAR